MKLINTLIKDVYHVAERENWFLPADAQRYSSEMASRVMERLAGQEKSASLRLSGMGERCPRSLWASVHSPSVQERFPAHVRIKFHFGDVVEAMAVALAKAAGHDVRGEQDELQLLGVKGHRDCIIDGNIVDVKSINSLGFQKVKARQVEEDIFLRNYLAQLDGYLLASHDDPLVTNKDTAFLWCIDKAMGHMCLYQHRLRSDFIQNRVTDYKAIVALPEAPALAAGF